MLNTHWDLEVLYKSFDDPQLAADFTWIGEETAALKVLAAADFDDPAEWLKEMLARLSALLECFEKVYNYGSKKDKVYFIPEWDNFLEKMKGEH